LGAGLTAKAISGDGWGCDLPSVSCTRSDVLAAGSSWPPVTVTVSVAGDASTGVVNSATVSGGGDDTPANDTSSDPTILTTPIPALGGASLTLLAAAMLALGGWTLLRRR